MSKSAVKKLSNVFIAAAGNKLQLADVLFDDKIREIRFKNYLPLEWKDISDRNRWNKFKSKLTDSLKKDDANSLNGDFLLLMAGAVDPHVHFDTPGFEEREDFEHASLAAAYGGVTSIIDMPCTSKPTVTNLKNLQIKDAAIKGRSWIDYAFWGGVASNDFSAGINIKKQIIELAEAGVVGFKAYLISGMDSFQDLTDTQMTQAARWIGETGKPLAVHAEEKTLVIEREMRFRSAGQNCWWAYCKARDDRAEAGAISKMANITGRTGCKIHIVHLSSEWGLNMVECAREEGLDFSAETCPHYLYFTQDDFDNPKIANFLKTAPPVKSEYDRDALWKGLQTGLLSFVTTDHAGCDPEKEKKSDNFWEVYGGIPGVEHRVPFLFSEGFLRGRLTLTQTIEFLSTSAAKYFGLYPKKGILQQGSDSDFVLINLWEPMMISASGMHSKGKYTPFEGIRFAARVEQTFLRGKLIASRTGKPEAQLGYGKRIC
jgi:allantoinase